MSTRLLKVKIKTLAAESALLRCEEHKVYDELRELLRYERRVLRAKFLRAANEEGPPVTDEDRVEVRKIQEQLARRLPEKMELSAHRRFMQIPVRDLTQTRGPKSRIDVRSETRSALLAYAFLRGRDRLILEEDPLSRPDLERVAQLVQQYSGAWGNAVVAKENVQDWYDGRRIKVRFPDGGPVLQSAQLHHAPAPSNGSFLRRFLSAVGLSGE